VGEMLKAAGDVGIQWMTDLCNAVVSEGKTGFLQRTEIPVRTGIVLEF
jgi:hypothetical protein